MQKTNKNSWKSRLKISKLIKYKAQKSRNKVQNSIMISTRGPQITYLVALINPYHLVLAVATVQGPSHQVRVVERRN